MSVIKPCSCKYKFQDERYGKGNRVFNVNRDGALASCTVCGREIRMRVGFAPPKGEESNG